MASRTPKVAISDVLPSRIQVESMAFSLFRDEQSMITDLEEQITWSELPKKRRHEYRLRALALLEEAI